MMIIYIYIYIYIDVHIKDFFYQPRTSTDKCSKWRICLFRWTTLQFFTDPASWQKSCENRSVTLDANSFIFQTPNIQKKLDKVNCTISDSSRCFRCLRCHCLCCLHCLFCRCCSCLCCRCPRCHCLCCHYLRCRCLHYHWLLAIIRHHDVQWDGISIFNCRWKFSCVLLESESVAHLIHSFCFVGIYVVSWYHDKKFMFNDQTL